MNTRKMEVAVIGALNIDILGSANMAFSSALSLPGEIRTSSGGTGFNAARAVALLGLDTAFFSVLAKDGHEAHIRAEAARCGVNTDFCRWDEGENNHWLSIRDADGKTLASVNDMTFSRRMDAFFCADAARAMADAHAVAADCDLQADALGKLAEKLEESIPLILNCVSPSKCMRAQPLLPRVHTLLARGTEAEKLTQYAGAERCAAALMKKGAQRVCLALEGEGFLLADREDMLRLPGDADSPGARGAVTAALCAAAAHGADLDKTAKLVQAAAAIAARCRDTVNPELSRLRDYI